MLIIYNSGRFRMAGRGSLSGLLSYGDANAIVQEMGQEVLPIVKKTPVLAVIPVPAPTPTKILPCATCALKSSIISLLVFLNISNPPVYIYDFISFPLNQSASGLQSLQTIYH